MKFSRHFLSIGSFLLIGILSGCGTLTRSEYQRPVTDIPARWGTSASGEAVAHSDTWWQTFKDPQLDALIVEALRTNNDLAAAAIKVRRAQLQARLANMNLTPSVSLGGNASSQSNLKNGNTSRSYGADLSLSYELDLWGRLSAVRDAAAWEAQATEADRQAAALSLIGTTADLYWQAAYLNQRLVSSNASIAYAARTLELTRNKYNAGAVSRLDVVSAEQNLAAQKADNTQLVQQLTETRHALAILFDQSPQHSVTERTTLVGTTLPVVTAGVPAELLSRRPDLRAAEYRLRETLANVDQVRTSFYPTLTLTGSAGASSTSLTNLLRDPIGTLGAGLTLPFIQWQTMQLNIQVSKTEYEEAVVNFRQTLYKSLAEVENALSARIQYQAQGEQLTQSLKLAQEAERLAEIRYRAGKTSLQDWLDRQDARRTAEISLAQNQLNRLQNAMKVFQTLGGGDQEVQES